MKYLLSFFWFVSTPPATAATVAVTDDILSQKISLYAMGSAVFQAVQNESPEDYENAIKKLTEQEFKTFVIERETKAKENIIHLIARVQSHRSYFVEQIPKLLNPLTFQEITEVIFKLNKNHRSPFYIAEEQENKEVFRILSTIREKIRENDSKSITRNQLKADIPLLKGVSLVFSLNVLGTILTEGEGPGGIAGGLASAAVVGLSCLATFQKRKQLQKLNRQLPPIDRL